MLHVGQNTIANLETFFCIRLQACLDNTCNFPKTLTIDSSNATRCFVQV